MMFYATATLIGNSVGENTFRKTRVDNSGAGAQNLFPRKLRDKPLDHRPAYYGSELKRYEPRQVC
jgi:hypothetical protein